MKDSAPLSSWLEPDGPVVQVLRAAFPDAIAIYAFGSRVTGHARLDSDLDLAVLVPGYAQPLALWNTSQRLADMLDCDVDLLDFRAASTVMQHQILTTGQRLWGDLLQAGVYEAFVMTEKLHLDEMRSGILADIAAEGKVYGR